MRIPDQLRLAVIAAGAFASVATSQLPTGVEVQGTSPLPNETAVAAGRAVELELYVNDVETEPSPLFVFLRAVDQARIEASTTWIEPIMTVRPGVPFEAETDYVMVVEDPGWMMEARWSDPLTGAYVGRPFDEFELPFSTRLQPTVRYAIRTGYSNPQVSVSFSRAMDASSFTAENVGLFNGVERVGVTLFYYEDDYHTLTLTPTATLPGTTLTLVLGETILASDGTPLARTELPVTP